MQPPDVLIAGAGIIGLSLALELASTGAHVTVLERSEPLGEASTAAAGMLAAEDPFNPPALLPLARLSLSLYPAWLSRIAELSGTPIPFQTRQTLQLLNYPNPHPLSPRELDSLLPPNHLDPTHLLLLDEHSIDPRQLAPALLRAVTLHSSIQLLPHTPVLDIQSTGSSALSVLTPSSRLHTSSFVDCTGAWARSPVVSVLPRKGQMLSLALPSQPSLNLTIRSEHLYIVPRLLGPNRGRAIVGATVEDAGYSKSVDPEVIHSLHHRAARLLPFLAEAPVAESWAGLRPATHDQLPILGALPGSPNRLLATGHYRNGILLAPATANVLTDLLAGRPPAVDLRPFAPDRPLSEPGPTLA